MPRSLLGVAMYVVCSSVSAQCQNLDGNWNLNVSTAPQALTSQGLRTDITQTKITLSGTTVTLTQAITLALTANNQAAFVDYDQPTTGTIKINPRTCRIRMVVNYVKQSVNASNVTTFKGDYVNISRGYAGKASVSSGGVVTAATFEMTPG